MKLAKPLCLLLSAAMLVNLAACGTILHPERRGQSGSRIDAGIAVLDGIGLLFFILPGVVAFAVDFSNGTIYLPGGHRAGLDGADGTQVVHADRKIDAAYLQQLLHDRLQVDADVTAPQVIVTRLESIDEVALRLATPTLSIAAR